MTWKFKLRETKPLPNTQKKNTPFYPLANSFSTNRQLIPIHYSKDIVNFTSCRCCEQNCLTFNIIRKITRPTTFLKIARFVILENIYFTFYLKKNRKLINCNAASLQLLLTHSYAITGFDYRAKNGLVQS